MKIKTSELVGTQLDWAVAKCEGATEFSSDGISICFMLHGKQRVLGNGFCPGMNYSPSTDWAQGGPIIERENIGIGHAWEGNDWLACAHDMSAPVICGPTPLTAAMRCYVASKLGDMVDIPDNLV